MAKTKYDLTSALKKHVAGLTAHLEYLNTQEFEAKNRTADQKPIFQGRIIEVKKEIEELAEIISEG